MSSRINRHGLIGCAVIGLLGCPQTEPDPAEHQATREPAPAEQGPVANEESEVDGPVEPEPTTKSGETAGETGESEAGETAGETGEPGDPVAPADYGVLVFPDPPPTEDELTLRGLAGYEIVAIHAKPDLDSTKLGFLRVGTRLKVTAKISDPDCPKGWYELEGGGFACASKGLVVDSKDPYLSYQPAKARTDQPFPYDWAYVRRWNAPMWWRVPTREEVAEAEKQRLVLEALREGKPLPGEEPSSSGDGGSAAAGETGGGDGPDDLPEVDDPDEGEPAVDDPPDPPEPPEPPEPSEPVEEPEPIKLPLNPGSPWLEKGFFVSIAEEVREDDRSYWRTARGGLVSKSDAYPYGAKDYQGNALTPEMSFPVGFVMVKDGTKLLELDEQGKTKVVRSVERRAFLDVEDEVEHAGKTYMRTVDGLLVKKDVLRMPDLQPIPKGLDAWDRWIDVDLGKQMLVAYEGARPVYVTLISSGKKGKPEEPFETPTGRFRIYSKQITSNMDGATATDGNYAIQDVPWVMYFEGSYALHGAFWHESFGSVRSHGCVNLGPSDARWLFQWTTPFLPESWHGVHANDDNLGTTVIIRDSGK
ncbi:L,D-transpeptidase family protein [Nannocystaceae bacterium ST9]